MIHAILRKSRFVNRFYLTHSNRMHLSKSSGKVHRRPPACGNRNQPFIFDEIPLHVLCWAQWQYLLDCDSDVARKRTVSRKYIAKEHWCLETLRNKRGSRMTLVNTSLVLIWNIDEAMTRRQKSLRVWQRTSRKRWTSKWKLLKHMNISTSCTESRARDTIDNDPN